MNDVIQVQTTTDQQELALAIARDLVENRLAACVQIGGPITSVYRWSGQVETATEWICTIKTSGELYDAVEQRIRRLHSYDEPEIVAGPITRLSDGYLRWLQTQVAVRPEGRS